MPRGKKIDWIKAKSEYIGDRNLTLRTLAKKYKITYNWIKIVSGREKWVILKDKRWRDAEEKALKKVEGSMENLIIRHAKVARLLQASGLKYLYLILDEVGDLMKQKKTEEARKKMHSLILNKIISDGTLRGIISDGLKAERELYPKQLDIQTNADVSVVGISEELTDAIYEGFRKSIGRTRPSIHKKVKRGKASNKKK